MAKLARLSVVLLVVLAATFVSSSVISSSIKSPVPALLQPFGPGIHRTYWLVGRSTSPGIGWNGTLPGHPLMADDGDNVTIMLESGDSIIHSWFIDFNNNGVVDNTTATNETATRSPDFQSATAWLNFTFTAALGKTIPHGGTFLYLCAQHVGEMYGQFTFNAGPVASFTHSPATPPVGHLVTFDASASWPSTGATITDFTWNFADGNITSSGNRPTITHTYVSINTFTVVLTITDTASQTAQASSNVAVRPLTSFDYQITTSPANATIFVGQSTTAQVNLILVTGPSENVSLSSSVSPATSTALVSLNVTSGFPPFRVGLSVTPGPSTGIYTITIIAMSSTGVAHNATFTLNLRPAPTPPPAPPNYFFYALVGAVVASVILAAFVILRRYRERTKL